LLIQHPIKPLILPMTIDRDEQGAAAVHNLIFKLYPLYIYI